MENRIDALTTIKSQSTTVTMMVEIRPATIRDDLTEYLWEFVQSYMNFLDLSLEEAAEKLDVSKSTLVNLSHLDKGIGWTSYVNILSGLVKSRCPIPKSRTITWLDGSVYSDYPNIDMKKYCKICDYYQFHQCVFKKAIDIETRNIKIKN